MPSPETDPTSGAIVPALARFNARTLSQSLTSELRALAGRDRRAALSVIETLIPLVSPDIAARLVGLHAQNRGPAEKTFQLADGVLAHAVSGPAKRAMLFATIQTLLRNRKDRAAADVALRRFFRYAAPLLELRPSILRNDGYHRIAFALRQMHDVSLFCQEEDVFRLERQLVERLAASLADPVEAGPAAALLLLERGLVAPEALIGRLDLANLPEEHVLFYSAAILALALCGDPAAATLVRTHLAIRTRAGVAVAVGEVFRRNFRLMSERARASAAEAPDDCGILYWIDGGVPRKATSAAYLDSLLAPGLTRVLAERGRPLRLVVDCGTEVSRLDRTEFATICASLFEARGLRGATACYVSQNFANATDEPAEAEADVIPFNTHFLFFEVPAPRDPDGDQRDIRFLCLNNIPKPHRIATLLHIQMRHGFHDTLYSFNHSFSNPPPNFNKKRIEPETIFNLYFDKYCNFELFNDNYNNFSEKCPKFIDLENRDQVNMMGRGAHVQRAHEEFFYRSLIHLVTESDFDDGGGVVRFTEKVFKPMATYAPFVVIGQPDTLSVLRELGFRTFGDYWDESYDAIRDPGERMRALFALIDTLAEHDVGEIRRMRRDMRGLLIHNFERLTWFRERGGQALLDRILDRSASSLALSAAS